MTASNTTDSTAFDITDWLGEWESFEHYIDSDDAAIQQTWEAAEQAVLANEDGPDGARVSGRSGRWLAPPPARRTSSISATGV